MRALSKLLAAGLLALTASAPQAAPPPSVAAVGQPVPDICFIDAHGTRACLSQWRGRVVLLNLWATWCAPCRQEMPQLDRVQAKLGGRDFEVLALSMDKRGAPAVRNFYERTGVHELAIYVDEQVRATEALAARGIPVSLLIDRHGKVVQRLSGPVDWSDAERLASIQHLMAPHGHNERGHTP